MPNIETLFETLRIAENQYGEVELKRAERIVHLDKQLAEAKRNVDSCMDEIAKWIKANPDKAVCPKTGELGKVVYVPSQQEGYSFAIGFQEGRERVNVSSDIDSIPEEFIRTVPAKREPDKVKISKHLKTLPSFPNWGSLDRGEPTLTYKLVKVSQ